MADLPPDLEPEPGEQGVATREPAAAWRRTVDAWDAFLAGLDAADLAAPSRSGRPALEVVVRLGAWPENRGLVQLLADARAGRADRRIDQDAVEERVLAAHRGLAPEAAVDGIRLARTHLAGFVDSGEAAEVALLPTATMLGPLPILTFLHATVYQLAVSAMDLEPVGAVVAPQLLADGLLALVDTLGALAARQRLTTSLTAVTGEAAVGFGSRGPAWRTLPRAAADGDPGPAVRADVRVLLDVTAGRGDNIVGLWLRHDLVTHDLPGLLRLAPLLDAVPGIPGGAALRGAARTLAGVGSLLTRLNPSG